MIVKYVLPMLAVVALIFAVQQVMQAKKETPPPEPTAQPARSPFKDRLAGAGMIEPRTENISVGSPVPGICVEVIEVGKRVKANETALFKLDDRPLQAELTVRRATLAAAQADYDKLKAQPRPEQLPPLRAQVEEMEASVNDMKDQLRRTQELYAKRVAPEEQLIRQQLALQMAESRLSRTKSELELLEKGAWERDLIIARAAIDKAQAQVKQIETDLERLTVRALVDGVVLQVNVRPGEFVGAQPGQTIVLLGNVDQLHVRVDIDEHDIPRFSPNTKARGALKGRQDDTFDLVYVREEPYVVPKKSLTGMNTERVDTRVLQVIYAVEPTKKHLYVGQQVDVFIDAPPLDKDGKDPAESRPAAPAASTPAK